MLGKTTGSEAADSDEASPNHKGEESIHTSSAKAIEAGSAGEGQTGLGRSIVESERRFPIESRYSTWHGCGFKTLTRKSKTHPPCSTKMPSLVLTLTKNNEAL
jgi:hypothetical protein